MKPENFYDGIPSQLPDELLSIVHCGRGVRIERIVSQGQSSPEGFWYDQDEDEWVIVLEGNAAVEFEGDAQPAELERGSYLHIPAHVRHRVARTDPDRKTFWLAIHYQDINDA